ncbi:MAG: hypothetical protein ABIQ01_05695 [Pseudolysinimonas sp.]
MPAVPQAAADHYRLQQHIGTVTASAALDLWRRIGVDFDTGWRQIEAAILDLIVTAQVAAARSSVGYLADVLYDTEQVDLPAGDIVPEQFSGTAADGRQLDSLMYGAVTTAKTAVGTGSSPEGALAQGGRWLTMTTLTTVADANREAVSAGIASRPHVGGWVRMLNPPSCKRCIILAGKWFRWNQGFQRHPRCDCRHIPASENIADDFTTDPYEMFRSLSTKQQDAMFGRSEARAIRDGGDIYRVGNIQARGLGTARSARLYGTPTRMTVDDIYRVAGHRTNAIRMLTENGYITGPQVAGGNVLGIREGFGSLGRGGTRKAASAAVEQARLTGIRDSLNRYTMTAAERRLYDAFSMRLTLLQGRNPWIRGADVTPQDLDLAERVLAKQLADLENQPDQVRTLARLLGLI